MFIHDSLFHCSISLFRYKLLVWWLSSKFLFFDRVLTFGDVHVTVCHLLRGNRLLVKSRKAFAQYSLYVVVLIKSSGYLLLA